MKIAVIGGFAALALAVTPMAPASAHGWHHGGGGLIFGLAALGAAAVVGAATIVTAPVRAIAAAPVYAPPPPAYYAPPPGYYAPPPAYYAPPQGYYYGR